MTTELFDVELNAVYEFNNRVTDYVVSLPPRPSPTSPPRASRRRRS